MPDRSRVEDLVARVRDGAYVEAIEAFYAEGATMQENLAAPREGRDHLMQHERGVLASLKQMRTVSAGPVLLDGDHAVIKWVFEMTLPDGSTRRLEELALQRWQGDRVVAEQFFYDPAQLAGRAS
jgi:hypothetical protein